MARIKTHRVAASALFLLQAEIDRHSDEQMPNCGGVPLYTNYDWILIQAAHLLEKAHAARVGEETRAQRYKPEDKK